MGKNWELPGATVEMGLQGEVLTFVRVLNCTGLNMDN